VSLARILLLVALSVVLAVPLSHAEEGNEGILHLSPAVWGTNPAVPTWRVKWRYHSGNNPSWALPDFDDRSWEYLSPGLRPDGLPKGGWPGVGWFRLSVEVDSTFPQIPIGMTGGHAGKVQVYWDGVLQSSDIEYRIPEELPVMQPGIHLLAVRYELHDISAIHERGEYAGFFIQLGTSRESTAKMLRQRAEQMFFTAMMLAFGFLHLMLFLFAPSSRGNLYYSLFLFSMAGAIYADIEHAFLAVSSESVQRFLLMHRALVPLTTIFFLRFLYAIFYDRCPRQFWVLTVLMLATGVIIVLHPNTLYHYYVIASSVFTLEMIRSLVVAIVRRKSGAWIVAAGFVAVALFGTYDTLLDLELMAPINQVTNAYYFGLAGMLGAMSIYLARDFARTSRRLLEQVRRTNQEEMARRLVEADNARKTRELEDARQLQLSLLPPCQNDIPGIDICFHMETATEIGGDYYDYLRPEDGSLILAIGDATGHGMKAGTMVAIVKSLFITHTSWGDLREFLKTSAEAIKQMRLGNLYMGLALARIKDRTLTMASAGMPPVLLYRHASRRVEEIVIKGMPLGGPGTISEELRSTELEEGDTLLMMSDGLAEVFNPEREILDYPRVRECFQEVAERSATDIVRRLAREGRRWANGRPQDDDITLVAAKIRS